jgi:NADPH-dependent F420 reductase
MKIGIVGGTGKEGTGLAIRWAKAGHEVVLGSRDGERGRLRAEELSREHEIRLAGSDNAGCCDGAEVVLLSVPYSGHEATCVELRAALAGKVVIDLTVPLKPPRRRSWTRPRETAKVARVRSMASSKSTSAFASATMPMPTSGSKATNAL